MALNQIPYTNVHELNLDWIIKKIQEFNNRIDQFQETIDTFAQYVVELEQLIPRITALESEYQQLRTAVSTLHSDVSTLHNSISSLETALNSERSTRAATDADLQRQINEILNSMINVAAMERRIKIYVDQNIKACDSRTDAKILTVNQRISAYYVELMQYINDIYAALAHVATDVYNTYAYDYSIDGRITFDLNNKLIYQHCANTLTAEEYCKLGLTAAEYAAYNLTAEEYLMFSRDRLHYDYVYTPITGVKQDHSVALSECINYALGTMSAAEYAALDLTAEDYAALDLTAYNYLRLTTDLTIGSRIIYSPNGSGISADQYAHLTID